MTTSRVLPGILLGALLAAAAGCGGGPRYAPVSGVVKVDGVPYKNAVVTFQPVGDAKNPFPGRGSSALTDENGRYVLKTDDGQDGAVVGKHKVRIQTKRDDPTAYIDPTVGSADNVPAADRKKALVDPIPAEWYSDTGGKDFDVPAEGTDKADFDIPAIPQAKKK